MVDPRSAPTRAQLRDRLRARGLRATEPRLAVLRALTGLSMPISHPELAERLVDQGMDRSTVYRNLLSLTEAGLTVRTALGDKVWRYELVEAEAPLHRAHPHVVCDDCGVVRCLPRDAVTVDERSVGIEVSSVQLHGRCGDCAGH